MQYAKIVTGSNGKVESVVYIDKSAQRANSVSTPNQSVVTLKCLRSQRLLLNSRSQTFPAGLANSSGVIGRYLTDSVGSDLTGYFPQLEKMPVHNHDGVGGMHMYMPWWRFGKKNEFLRGYHIEFGGGRDMPGVDGFDYVAKSRKATAPCKTKVSQFLRNVHWIQRPRRDDPQ